MNHSENFTVYRLTNRTTKRHYYGRTLNAKKRFIQHTNMLRAGTHDNKHLQADHTEKTKYSFKVIKDNLDRKEANFLSDKLAKEDDTRYNILGITPSNRSGGRKYLPESDAAAIRDMYFNDKYRQSDIAEEFGVTQGTISLIVNGLVHNIGGKFTKPTNLPEGSVHGKFGKKRHEIRAAYRALRDQRVPAQIALEEVSKQFDCLIGTVKYWLKNEPKIRNYVSQNLNHTGVSVRSAIIDGVEYYSTTRFCRETGYSIHNLIWKSPHIWETRENRSILINGVKIILGTQHVVKALRENGCWPAYKIKELEYVSWDPDKHDLPYRHSGAASETRHQNCLRAGLLALQDPVFARSGRINKNQTAKKHNVSYVAINKAMKFIADRERALAAEALAGS